MAPFILSEKRENTHKLFGAVAVSVFGVINVTLFAFGIPHTTATIAQLLYAVVPVIAAILSYFLLKEQFTGRKILGIVLGLVGILFLILLPVITKGSLYAGTTYGNMIVMVAVVLFSTYTVLSKRYQTYFSPKIMTFIFAATTALTLAPFSILEYMNNPVWLSQITVPTVLSVLYIGVFGGAAYYLLYQYAIKHGNPVIASMTMFLQPIATYVWAVSLLGEKLIPGIVIGAITSITGAWLVISTTKKAT